MNIADYIRRKRVRAILCALFMLFALVYVLSYERDVIVFTFDKLFGKDNFYDTSAGPWLLILSLLLLQRLVSKTIYFRDRHYTLTFLPSAIVAALLTSFVPYCNWVSLLVTLFCLAFWILQHRIDYRRQEKDRKRASYRLVPRLTWHCMWLLALVAYMGLAGNADTYFHQELKMARFISEGKYRSVLDCSVNPPGTSVITAMRAYAQSRSGKSIADELFRYPLQNVGDSVLLLHHHDAKRTPFQASAIFRQIGVWPHRGESASQYLERGAKYRPYALFTPGRDYYLCGLLLNKQIDRFVSEFCKYHAFSDTLSIPRAYAEALILYQRIRSNRQIQYKNELMEANYQDFIDKRNNYPSEYERANVLAVLYGDTYWWYYYYSNLK